MKNEFNIRKVGQLVNVENGSPIVTYNAGGSGKASPAAASPATILFLAANPSDTTRLALDREVREIDQRLRSAKLHDVFKLDQKWAVRIADLQQYLLDHRPTIVHFSGHGNSAGQLIFEDAAGNARPASNTALANLFGILAPKIRLVVLNACFSDVQAHAIAAHVDCVIGMTTGIKDSTAIAFAGAFYHALGSGEAVQQAFRFGCNQVDLTGLAQPDVPHLIVRKGVDANKIKLADAGSL